MSDKGKQMSYRRCLKKKKKKREDLKLIGNLTNVMSPKIIYRT